MTSAAVPPKTRLIGVARQILLDTPRYQDDVRRHAKTSGSVAGCLLALENGLERSYAERIMLLALRDVAASLQTAGHTIANEVEHAETN